MIALFILMILVAVVFAMVLFCALIVPFIGIARLATYKSKPKSPQPPLRAPTEKEWRKQQAKERKRWGALAMLTVKGNR
jgi:hypothetical protein